MSRLVISLGSLAVVTLRIAEGTTRIGRDRGNDVVLSLPEVADFHAEIVCGADGDATIQTVGEELFLLNGRPVRSAGLSSAGQILLGGYRLRWIEAPRGTPLVDGTVEAKGSGEAQDAEGAPPTMPVEAPHSAGHGPVKRLVVIAGHDSGLAIPVEQPAIVVGRAPDCDVVLSDTTVSWRHFSLERAPDGVRVRDLTSRNGTLVDGSRIESALAGAGSQVRVGRTTLLLEGDAAPEEAAGIAAPPEAAGLPAIAHDGLAELVGRSPAMQTVYVLIQEAASSRVPVLLAGETGTGKELAARAIHTLGGRAAGPFVPVNCAAISRDMLEDELFGHARGAFTGAAAERKGAFEAADGGTIFLDEISEMPLDLQPKLLRVLEDGCVPRVGGGGGRSDFRVIAASNRDLPVEAQEGRFRQDLFYRLSVFPIVLPPLSDRIEDLAPLVHHFLERAEEYAGLLSTGAIRFDEDAFIPLREHTWPGNVRELRNVILRAVVRRTGGVIDRDLVEVLLAETTRRTPGASSPGVGSTAGTGMQRTADSPAATAGRRGAAEPAAVGDAEAGSPPSRSLKEMEREAIRNALHDCGGQRRAAARRLGIAESTLYEKLRRYGIADEVEPG
jgi:DNA-binding NtrC family response regulator/pSer/pThr/pTyr-binding forkhead associated (FHA) protein